MYASLQRIPGIYCKSKKLLSHHSTLFPKGTVGQIQSTSNRVAFRTFSIEPGMDKTSKVSAESSGGKKNKVVNLKEERPTDKSPLSNNKEKLSQTLAN